MMVAADFDVVLCEYRNADVVGFRRIDGEFMVVTMEFERTVRNVLRNIRRNLANGSNWVLEVCMSPSLKASVNRLVEKRLTPCEREKVRVVSRNELSTQLLRSLNGKNEVDSALFRLVRPVDSEENKVSSPGTQVDSGGFGEGVTATSVKTKSREGGETGKGETSRVAAETTREQSIRREP